MSCLIFTWHERRQLSFASFLLICPASVGKISPPPSNTWHLHKAQVPPPPQAEGKNIFSADNADNSVEPGATIIDSFSLSFIIRETLS